MTSISFVLTSCGRFDLLEQTLDSFFHFNTAPIRQFIVVEDSGETGVEALLRKYPASFEVIVNHETRGQIASIDAAYRRVSEPLIFHCEDDWLFLRPGFIEDSIKVIEVDSAASMVNLVIPGILPEMDEVLESYDLKTVDGVSYRVLASDSHVLWFGYSFGARPTMRNWVASSRSAMSPTSVCISSRVAWGLPFWKTGPVLTWVNIDT